MSGVSGVVFGAASIALILFLFLGAGWLARQVTGRRPAQGVGESSGDQAGVNGSRSPMPRRDIAQLGCRILAAYLGLQLILTVTELPIVIGTPGLLLYVSFVLGSAILFYGVSAVLIWVYSDRLSKALIWDDGSTPVVKRLSRGDLVLGVVAAMGLYFVVTAIPSVVSYIIDALSISSVSNGLASLFHSHGRQIVESVAYLVVGLVMFFWCKHILAFVERVRRQEVINHD